jgi:DNA-binding MarR family transcriptional regulator
LITIGPQRSRLDPHPAVATATPIASAEQAEPGDRRHRLPFDPIAAAAHSWEQRWPERDRMEAVTSLMRVHQLVITELDERLRPLELTFARFEVLVLLAFSRRGSLPLGKIGERLQVHATSVTPLVKRLEASGYLTRNKHPEDGRAVLAEITPLGREITERARAVITDAQFGLGSLDEEQCRALTAMLAAPRAAAGDF